MKVRNSFINSSIGISVGFMLLICVACFALMLNNCQPNETEKQNHEIINDSANQLRMPPSKPIRKFKYDTFYRPVRWGGVLKINVASKGINTKYPPYWLANAYGNNLIEPANYIQTPLIEKIFLGDTFELKLSDTLFICRKEIRIKI